MMESNSQVERTGGSSPRGPRHSILDLAPLELECMCVLWAIQEGTVRTIHDRLAKVRPRAYTTVLTIMDRLAQKGIATRRKAGRAFLYQAKLSAEEARLKAIEKIVDGFFDGSPEALAAQLSSYSRTKRGLSTPDSGSVDGESQSARELQVRNQDKALL